MSPCIHSLLPSSKTLLPIILIIFYSEINDISLKSFKQSVLNTKLYFDEKTLSTFANIFKFRIGRVSLNAILCFFPFEICVLSQNNQHRSQGIDILGSGLNILVNSSSADMSALLLFK